MRDRILILLGALALLLTVLVPATATAAPDGAIRPVRHCETLVRDYAIPGARTHVTNAKEVAGAPAYCEVLGFVEPAVQFRLRLPLDNFRGRYLQYGCG